MSDLTIVLLVAATFLCGLTAGLVFTFAVVVMPGIRRLSDREFLESFGAMDRIIQENDPLFMLAWVGSALALLAAAILGFGAVAGIERWLLLGAAAAYLLFVQLPTILVNVPLNNRLQALDLDSMDAAQLKAFRSEFEGRWNRWNRFRNRFRPAGSAGADLTRAGGARQIRSHSRRKYSGTPRSSTSTTSSNPSSRRNR